MRALVAGGAGLIGSHLCEALLRRGHGVVCVDNLCTGQRENLEALRGHPRFEFVHHDVVRPLPRFAPLHRVYHLASPASPRGYSRLPIETLRVNSEGTLRLLELAQAHRARLLYASTSEIYGDPLQHPQSEHYRGNVSSIGPRSMYDEAKRYGEALVTAFARSNGVDGRIVRIFNTYGPRCGPDDGRMVSNLATQALRGEPMTIYGNGLQTRSLCYVADLVEGLIATLESPKAKGIVINLGNPEEHTVLEFARWVREITGSRSELVFTQPAVGDDPQVRCPDISRARTVLNWSPRVGLDEGLRHTIEYLRAVLEQQPAANGNGNGNGATPHGSTPDGAVARLRARENGH